MYKYKIKMPLTDFLELKSLLKNMQDAYKFSYDLASNPINTYEINSLSDYEKYINQKNKIMHINQSWLNEDILLYICMSLNTIVHRYPLTHFIPNLLYVNLNISHSQNNKLERKICVCSECALYSLCSKNYIAGEKVNLIDTPSKEKCQLNQIILEASSVIQFMEISQIPMNALTCVEYNKLKSIYIIQAFGIS